MTATLKVAVTCERSGWNTDSSQVGLISRRAACAALSILGLPPAALASSEVKKALRKRLEGSGTDLRQGGAAEGFSPFGNQKKLVMFPEWMLGSWKVRSKLKTRSGH